LQYFIGVDGGGTKTALCAACADSTFLRRIETSGSSWREHGVPEVVEKLKKALHDLMGDDKDTVAGIAMGLPCYGESIEGDRSLKQAIDDTFAPIPVYLTNDVEVGWAGSLALQPGINIVAGTGSIAFGKDNQGQTARSGGWSEFFGDEGSSYWMGRKVMELFSKQSDGRMPKDELYTVICQEFNLQDDFSFIDLMHNEYIPYRKQVARLQLLAEKAALAGSSSATALYNEAGRELLLLVAAVHDQLNFTEKPWIVSYSGGLFKAGELILPQLSEAIEKKGGKLIPPCFDPVEGAVLLAYQYFCSDKINQVKKIIQDSRMINKGVKP
jgi:N-acetylglucosamine kinase-like BadF-type ATPase